MSMVRPPVVGTWYVSRSGKLLLVKMLSYVGKRPQRVMIELQEGATRVVAMEDWLKLDLQIRAWVPAHQRSIFKTSLSN